MKLIHYEYLLAIKAQLIAFKHIDEIKIDGLLVERIPVFASGVAILIALFESFAVKTLHLSSGALREGLLYDMLPAAKSVDIASLTINSMMAKYHVEQAHSERVSRLAQTIFHACEPQWNVLNPEDLSLISAACQLHEIGLLIEYKKHQKHGAYIIENSQLLGFTQTEQQTLSLLVGHQKESINAKVLADQLLPYNKCLALLIIVRTAILLASRRQDAELPELTPSAQKQKLSLGIAPEWLERHPLIKDELSTEADRLAELGFTLSAQT